MDKYLQAEKELAELLGWKDVGTGVLEGLSGRPPKPTGGKFWHKVPNWTGDNAAAFTLMVEQRLLVSVDDVEIEANFGGSTFIRIADHPDKEAAVRYAIVQAVIAKLRSEHAKP